MGHSKKYSGELPMTLIHPTAIVEADAKIGRGTRILDHAHVMRGANIGEECIVGAKSHIAGDVRIGNHVRIEPLAYICGNVIIEDSVLISAAAVFAANKFPRATLPNLRAVCSSNADEQTMMTLVREGASIGAGCVIGNDLEIGRWAMVGMGSTVTASVPDFHLVVGSPGRSIGAVCKCGSLFHLFTDGDNGSFKCECGLRYQISESVVNEMPITVQKRHVVRHLQYAAA